MNIDDFLKRKQFLDLDEYLTSEMERTAGEDLISQMIIFLKTKEKARDFYFSNNRALGGVRPYDVCREGKQDVVRTILMHLYFGDHS